MSNHSISVEGMAAVEKERARKKAALDQLISEPFDIKNSKHLAAVKEYTANFECSKNRMYLFNGMSEAISIGGGGWLLGLLLPIPNFIRYFFSYFFYLGVISFVLERFSMTNFYEQLDEMKIIYNWCFKGNLQQYSPDMDNSEKLANPELQTLLKTIAPVCSVDFLLVWPRKTAITTAPTTGWSNVLSAGYSAAAATVSLFTARQPRIDLKRVRELQTAVEKREFDMGVLNGFKYAINYFISRDFVQPTVNNAINYFISNYRDFLQPTVDVAKDKLPSAVSLATLR